MKLNLLIILSFIQISIFAQDTENPVEYNYTILYESDFTSGTDEWLTADRGGTGASSYVEVVDGELACRITSIGSISSDIKLYRPGIVLKPETQYKVTFRARAQQQRTIIAYIGESRQPYAAFSGYKGYSVGVTTQEYSYTFGMTAVDSDDNARIKFDVGNYLPDLYIEYIKVEELSVKDPTGIKQVKDVQSAVYPNPVKDILFIDNKDEFQEVQIITLSGKVVKQQEVVKGVNEVNMTEFKAGMYFVALSKEEGRYTMKVMKK